MLSAMSILAFFAHLAVFAALLILSIRELLTGGDRAFAGATACMAMAGGWLLLWYFSAKSAARARTALPQFPASITLQATAAQRLGIGCAMMGVAAFVVFVLLASKQPANPLAYIFAFAPLCLAAIQFFGQARMTLSRRCLTVETWGDSTVYEWKDVARAITTNRGQVLILSFARGSGYKGRVFLGNFGLQKSDLA